MYLVVNAQSLQSPGARHRGIGRYGRHLLQELARARPEWRVEAVTNTQLPEPDSFDAGLRVTLRPFEPPLPLGAASREANERYFADWLTALTPDVVLELSFFEEIGLVPRFGVSRPILAGVAYDLIPLVFHRQYLADPAAEAFYGGRLRQLAAADLLLAISEATRDDVRRLLDWPDDRVVAILGAAEFPPADGLAADGVEARAILNRFDIDRSFLLYVGGTDYRKNLSGTLAAYAELPASTRQDHLLVIVCALTAAQEASLREQAARLGIERNLRLTNFVDDAVLQTLYRSCRLSIFPSLYEGLGLPVLEALSCGAPVVASTCAAIREFAGDVSELADPASPRAIAAAIAKTLSEPRDAGADARRRFAAGFRWGDTARRAASAIERATRRVEPRDARPRIAWVSPLPPTESAAAGRSAALLERIAPAFDIEVVIAGDSTADSGIAQRFRVLRADEVDARHETAPFDLFVFHAGDGEPHLYMLELLRRHSGLTVLHEIRLGRLALAAAAVGAWPDLAGELDAEGAADLAAGVRRGASDDRKMTDACLIRPFLHSSDAAAVWDAADWGPVRARTMGPVFSLDGARGLDFAAARLAAAIHVTHAARARLDGNWRDATAAALAEASPNQPVSAELIEGWARLRAAAAGTVDRVGWRT
jgi:glycosyltransferase involved in cell wall biosynthesis